MKSDEHISVFALITTYVLGLILIYIRTKPYRLSLRFFPLTGTFCHFDRCDCNHFVLLYTYLCAILILGTVQMNLAGVFRENHLRMPPGAAPE